MSEQEKFYWFLNQIIKAWVLASVIIVVSIIGLTIYDDYQIKNTKWELGGLNVTSSLTVKKEGDFFCVYEGEYEENETPLFKSSSATEAIQWALDNSWKYNLVSTINQEVRK